MALEADVPLIEGRERSHGPLTRLFPANPTGIVVHRRLHDGDTVVLSGVAFRVYAVPGHTAGSAAYYVNGVRWSIPPGKYVVFVTAKGVPEKYQTTTTSGITIDVTAGASNHDIELK